MFNIEHNEGTLHVFAHYVSSPEEYHAESGVKRPLYYSNSRIKGMINIFFGIT